jgi:hypothetical protein
MKIYYSTSIVQAFVLALLVIIFASCEKEEISMRPPAGDYYPSKIGSTWEYQFTVDAPWETSSYTTMKAALQDTTYEGKQYTYYGLQLIRKEKGTYYRRTNFYGIGEEYPFLKDYLPVGGTWTHSSYPEHKAEFTITAVHPIITVNGKQYKDVIEVQKQDFYIYDAAAGFTLGKTITSYYAKGIGEIHSIEAYIDQSSAVYEYKLISYELK